MATGAGGRNLRVMIWLGVGLAALLLSGCRDAACRKPGYPQQRRAMVRDQIRARGITNKRVLRAMRKVPRHRFMPKSVRRYAYADRPVPIGHRQTISQPYIVAYMTDAIRPKPSDKVLEVGTGSGYQAAVLSRLVKHVYSIEIVRPLALQARQTFKALGYQNITVRIGDGYQGWPQHAPFDAIVVTAAPPSIPRPLLKQLKQGGELVIPVGKGTQELIRVTRTATGYKRERLLPVRFVPMTGKAQQPPRLRRRRAAPR
jgi:protein-L-isoaspartate(D-aspartate) O-methyltransferase